MLSYAVQSDPQPSISGAERRKEIRHRVELRAALRFQDRELPAQIGELSMSGALVFLKDPPPTGSDVELIIEDANPIAAKIMHSGQYFCGLALANQKHRDLFLKWIPRS
jgi:hypothetical protein